MKDSNYYELRYLRNFNQNSIDFNLDENRQKTLENIVFEQNKVLLLGNPGLGKSTELNNLFEVLWDKIDSTGLIPFLIELKNFRPINRFEDLITNENWKDYPQVIFILDGLDEITNIEDFISELEVFIKRNKKANYKYVISCRTNIFHKYFVNIKDFIAYTLDDLSFEQSKNILLKKYCINYESIPLSGKHFDFIKNPFFLNLFAEYYLSEKKIPNSEAHLWDIYIEKQLINFRTKIKKKRVLNIPQEIKYLKTIALINELRNKSFIEEDDIYKALGDKSINFLENPFIINLELAQNKYKFIHRQIQEYFVAKSLADKNFSLIKSFITIKNLNRISPNLLNSTSFLINLMNDDEERDKLLDWIKESQIEVLIKADSDRIHKSLRIEVFQNHFISHCIDKSYWINTSSSLRIKEIAEFGDNLENYEFLIKHIKQNIHFRIVISALELLGFFNIKQLNKVEELKEFLMSILINDSYKNNIKANVIDCIHKQGFAKQDPIYLKSIFVLFLNSSDNELNRELLDLLTDYKDIDEYFEFIKNEFLFENKIKKREKDDEVGRGNGYILVQLISRLEDRNNFLEIAYYYFDRTQNIDVYLDDIHEIIKKCLEFDKKDSNFVLDLIKKVKVKNRHFYFDQDLNNLLSKVNDESRKKIITYFLEIYPFQEIYYDLVNIVNENSLSTLIDFILKKVELLNRNEIEYFRNSLFQNKSRLLAEKFNQEIETVGFVFKEPLPTEEELELKKEYEIIRLQSNFDILFNSDLLTAEIKKIFDANSNDIDKILFSKINKEWYEKNGHWKTIDTSYEVLRTIIYRFRRTINIDDVKNEVSNPDFLITQIVKKIKNTQSKSTFEIKKLQLEYIENWAVEKAENIDFNSLIEYNDNDSLSMKEDYYKWEKIIFLSRKFNFDLPQEFLIHSIKIPHIKDFYEDVTCFEYLTSKVCDKESLNNQVIEYLKTMDVDIHFKQKHIEYALQNRLEDTYTSIKELLVKNNSQLNIHKLIELYHKTVPEDKDFLKDCAKDIMNHKTWVAISIMVENKIELEFCRQKSIEYLELAIRDKHKFHTSNSLQVLFALNDFKAIEYFLKVGDNDQTYPPEQKYFNNYNAINDFNIIINLFDLVYGFSSFNRKFSTLRNFLDQYISNLSKEYESYKKVKEVLTKKTGELIRNNDKDNLFHVNLLLDIADNSYYNSQSKALSLDEALIKVEEII